MSRKRKRRDHPEVIFWDQMAATCKECHTLTKKQHGYLQLLTQIATLTRHDEMVQDGVKWNEQYDFTNSSPEEIRLFLDQWWQSFLQARSEQTTAREKAVERVRKAAAGSAQDVSKAAIAELEKVTRPWKPSYAAGLGSCARPPDTRSSRYRTPRTRT